MPPLHKRSLETPLRRRCRFIGGWTDAQVTVTVTCDAPGFVNTGLYEELGGENGPVVTVSATDVPYPSFFQGLGIIDSTYNLSATSNAPVIGL